MAKAIAGSCWQFVARFLILVLLFQPASSLLSVKTFAQNLYEGNLRDPLSLHKYTYCSLDPVNNVDPTGFQSLSDFGNLGTAVHFFIGRDFVGSAPQNRTRRANIGITRITSERGTQIPRRERGEVFLGRSRPDLIDFGAPAPTNNIYNFNNDDFLAYIFEIKTAAQAAIGEREVLEYLALLNAYDPGWRMGTALDYIAPANFTLTSGGVIYRIDTSAPVNGVIRYRATPLSPTLVPIPIPVPVLDPNTIPTSQFRKLSQVHTLIAAGLAAALASAVLLSSRGVAR